VNLELELDSNLVSEPDKLKERIRQLFSLVRSSLTEELNGGNGHNSTAPAASTPPSAPSARPTESPKRNGSSGSTRGATPSQVKAIYAIARSRQVKLLDLLRGRFGVSRPDDLSLFEASGLIDEAETSEIQTAG
jgi:hypothetical protein